MSQDKNFHGFDPKNLQIIIIPFYTYRLYSKAEKNITSFQNLIPDSSFRRVCYDLEYSDGRLFCFPTEKLYKSVLSPTISFIQADLQNEFYYKISKAFNFSKDLFCINVLSREKITQDPYAIYDGKKIKCINHEMKIYSGINEFIINQYGGVEKYIEFCIEDSVRSAILKKMSIEDCKEIFRNDYIYWERYVASDTTSILKIFVHEVDSVAKLQSHQRVLLINKLEEDIIKGSSIKMAECSCEFSLLHKDITFTMTSTLTEEQLNKYRKYIRIKKWLQAQAMVKLNDYYLTDRKISIENENEIFEKEVYPHKN